MNEKRPLALELADELDHALLHDAADELRRVYARFIAADRMAEQAVQGCEQLRAQFDLLLAALKRIAAIENKMVGLDWEEIEEARGIATAAIQSIDWPMPRGGRAAEGDG